jgi:hypothetical protein
MANERPRMTIFATAFTSGVLLTLVAQMLASHAGLTLEPAWAHQDAANRAQMLAAVGWWTIAGAGFVGSFGAGLLMQDAPGGQRRQALRGAVAALVFVLLVAIPYVVTAGPASGLRQSLLTDAAVFALGLLTSFCGSWFSLPR